MKTIINLMAPFASLVLLTSCFTSYDPLAYSRMRERNKSYQLEQEKREEAAWREIFNVDANKALSATVNELATELYGELGKSAVPEHDFATKNISYYYDAKQAVCPVTFYLRRRNQDVIIKGNLTYYDNARQQVKFVCTDAINTRKGDRKYIRTLSEGIIFNTK